MSSSLEEIRYQLAVGNRILANEGVLDAFGHLSVRDPHDAGRFFISRHQSPLLVEMADVVELDLDSEPVAPTSVRLYGERVIHGCLYQARPEVQAVLHHHAPAIMPYAVSGAALRPVFHLGSVIGSTVPLWDSRNEFGDTPIVVTKPDEARSLARALGPHWMVLMRHHGATVVGTSLQETVFRAVYSRDNAEFQMKAQLVGTVSALTEGEAEAARAYLLRPQVVQRAWDYWIVRLEQSGQMPARET